VNYKQQLLPIKDRTLHLAVTGGSWTRTSTDYGDRFILICARLPGKWRHSSRNFK